MVGRTCAFASKYHAHELFSDLFSDHDTNLEYDIVMVGVKLTCDLLQGDYGGYMVVGGRHMKILGEV